MLHQQKTVDRKRKARLLIVRLGVIQRIICRVNQPCDMIYRAYQVASIMHIFPSVDIIVYDITRGSGLLPGNKAYHQTSARDSPRKARCRAWPASTRAARSSLHPHPRDCYEGAPPTLSHLTAENTAFSCPITALVPRYGIFFFFSFLITILLFSFFNREKFLFGKSSLIL